MCAPTLHTRTQWAYPVVVVTFICTYSHAHSRISTVQSQSLNWVMSPATSRWDTAVNPVSVTWLCLSSSVHAMFCILAGCQSWVNQSLSQFSSFQFCLFQFSCPDFFFLVCNFSCPFQFTTIGVANEFLRLIWTRSLWTCFTSPPNNVVKTPPHFLG